MIIFPRFMYVPAKPQRSPVQTLPNEVLTAALRTGPDEPGAMRKKLVSLARTCKTYEQASAQERRSTTPRQLHK